MRDIRKIIQLRVLLVLVGLLVIIWSILCVSSIRTNIGLKNPKEVTGKDSPFLKSGNVVSVDYAYLFDASLISGFALGRDHYYEIIKFCDKEEFLYCVFIGEDKSFLDDKPFYRMYREIEEIESEDNYMFVGKVRRMNKHIKEGLKHNATVSNESIYKDPNSLTDTNFDYYIQYIEPEEELSRMLGRLTFWGILIVSLLFLIVKLRQEQSAYLFCLNVERVNKKKQHRIEVEKQLKESGKRIENVEFEGESDGK